MLSNLKTLIFRRSGQPQAVQATVMVTVECPWAGRQIKRVGAVDSLLAGRTLGEVVQVLARDASGGQYRLLPAQYSLRVRNLTDQAFRVANAETQACIYLEAESQGVVRQLRIQVVPAYEQAAGEEQPTVNAPAAADREDPVAEPTPDPPPAPQAPPAPAASQEERPRPDNGSGSLPQAAPPAPVVARDRRHDDGPGPVPATERSGAVGKGKGYIRKSDLLREQVQPKIEALDFSGLFVGNFGLRPETVAKTPRVSLISPAEANKDLMQGNQHRRGGQHGQASHCYRTLITHFPENEDYWFLLGKSEEDRGEYRQAVHALENAARLGHDSAREEIARIEQEHGLPARDAQSLVDLWRPSFPEQS